jgi:hypothetical protein
MHVFSLWFCDSVDFLWFGTCAWQQHDTNIKTASGNYNRKTEQQNPSA